MGKSWYSSGFSAAKKEEAAQKERRKSGGIYALRMDDGEERTTRWLNTEPFLCHVHNVNVGRGGEQRWEKVVCTGKKCRHCKRGERKQFVGVWLVIDHTSKVWDKDKKKFKKKKNGEFLTEMKLRYWMRGNKDIKQIERIAVKRADEDLTAYTLLVSRTGATKDDTTYSYDLLDPEKLSKAEKEIIKEREIPVGDHEAMMDYIANVLMPPGSDDDDDDDDEDEDDDDDRPAKKKSKGKNRKSMYRPEDDDDEDEDSEDDEDEDDDPPPRKKAASKKPATKSKKSSRTVEVEYEED